MSTEVLPQIETPVEPIRDLYGLMAEFETQQELLHACEVAEISYRKFKELARQDAPLLPRKNGPARV